MVISFPFVHSSLLSSFPFSSRHKCLVGSMTCNRLGMPTASPQVFHTATRLCRGVSILSLRFLFWVWEEFVYTWHGKETVIGTYTGAHKVAGCI